MWAIGRPAFNSSPGSGGRSGTLSRMRSRSPTARPLERRAKNSAAVSGRSIVIMEIRHKRLNAGEAHARSEEQTSELQSLMRTSYAVFCLKKKKHNTILHK